MTNLNGVLPRSRLYDRVLELLSNRPITMTLERIARETGLPHAWLVSILGKREMQPAVNRVEILYEYLSGSKLDIK